jgi:hypothetical protein
MLFPFLKLPPTQNAYPLHRLDRLRAFPKTLAANSGRKYGGNDG